jgi:peptidoglycan/LPS O-acetylase OafA/YrhL
MNLRYIDALRGFAVIGVILVHCAQVGGNNYPFLIENLFRNGAMGVQLFFMVSAFTLFLSYNGRKNLENNTKLNFFIRRFFRIAPLYYVAILYYLYQNGMGARPTLGDINYVSQGNILSNFFFVHGLNPQWINSIVPGGWSISVEMFFYCLMPFLAKKITNTNRALLFFTITLLIKILSDFVITNIHHSNDSGYWSNFIFYYFPTQFPIFAIGILLYFIITQKEILATINVKYVFIAGLILLIHQMLEHNSAHIAFSIVYIIFIVALANSSNKFIVNKFFVYLGKLSFSLYLFHFAAIYWMGKWGLVDIISSARVSTSLVNFAIRFSILLIFSIIGANVLYLLIEKPFLSLGKKLIAITELKFKIK